MLEIVKDKEKTYINVDDLEDLLLDMVAYLIENNVSYNGVEVLCDVVQILLDITKEENKGE